MSGSWAGPDAATVSLDSTLQDEAVQPCDLTNFTGYLCHVEHRAEYLQFFLWYCDYVDRWSRLVPDPMSDVDANVEVDVNVDTDALVPPRPAYTVHSTRSTLSLGSDDLITSVLQVLERTPPEPESTSTPKPKPKPKPKAKTLDMVEAVDIACMEPPDWCRRYRQALLETDPGTRTKTKTKDKSSHARLRVELDRAADLYLRRAAPRALPDDRFFFAAERDACLRMLDASPSAHPSALLPAFFAADAALRKRLFAAFVRRACVANMDAHSARRIVVAVLAVFVFWAGLVLELLLVASVRARAPRVVCLVLWWPALAALWLATRHSIDLVLFVRRERLLRPWEASRSDVENAETKSGDPGTDKNGNYPCHAPSAVDIDIDKEKHLGARSAAAEHCRRAVWRQALAEYGRASVWRQMADELRPRACRRVAPVLHDGVHALQRRLVYRAIAGSGAVAVAMAVASFFLPRF